MIVSTTGSNSCCSGMLSVRKPVTVLMCLLRFVIWFWSEDVLPQNCGMSNPEAAIAPPVAGRLCVAAAGSVSMTKGVGGHQSRNFQTASATVAKGGKVTWPNNDVANHTVTSTTTPTGAASFNSGNMGPIATYTATFPVDGT